MKASVFPSGEMHEVTAWGGAPPAPRPAPPRPPRPPAAPPGGMHAVDGERATSAAPPAPAPRPPPPNPAFTSGDVAAPVRTQLKSASVQRQREPLASTSMV